jgi:integrase
VPTTPVDEELHRFDERMNHAQGLAPTTRTEYLRTVRRLLVEQFGDRAIDFDTITPECVRRFVASQSELYSTPGSAATLISALRGYFRFRATCGDRVHALLGVLPYPANWQLASLPKGLSDAEVRRLVDSLGWEGPSARRADAMVRCALDLGLRSGEIATLGLDDIDWQAGTITLRRTKSRREDTLPLPPTTGVPSPITWCTNARRAPVGRSSFAASRLATARSAPTACARAFAKLTPVPVCPIPARTCCATPWPVACWRAAARSRRWPMSCAIVRSTPR